MARTGFAAIRLITPRPSCKRTGTDEEVKSPFFSEGTGFPWQLARLARAVIKTRESASQRS
jgi:hypothetical protein